MIMMTFSLHVKTKSGTFLQLSAAAGGTQEGQRSQETRRVGGSRGTEGSEVNRYHVTGVWVRDLRSFSHEVLLFALLVSCWNQVELYVADTLLQRKAPD